MYSSTRHLLTLFTAMTAGICSVQAEDILLRSEAKTDAPVIASVDSEAAAITEAAAVLDSEQAAAGWMWTEYTTTISGYVATGDLGKNFDLPDATLVRSAPNSSASILTVAQPDDTFEYLETNGNWATFRFTKPIPVYFQVEGAEVPMASLATAAAVETETAPTILPADPDTNGEIRVSYGSAPAPEVDPAVLELEQPIVEQTTEAPTPEQPIIAEAPEVAAPSAPRRPAPDAVTSRILSGKLIRETRGSGPNYPIRLLGPSGKQLAYVDMSRIFINDLRPYLNEAVYIRGEVRPLLPGSKELIILARTIQLAK